TLRRRPPHLHVASCRRRAAAASYHRAGCPRAAPIRPPARQACPRADAPTGNLTHRRALAEPSPGRYRNHAARTGVDRGYIHVEMSDRTETMSSNGGGADLDAVETSEWLEAIDAVVAHDGPDRARQILTRVVERAQHAGTGPIASLNTPY